jgi:sec-independent protein translocase protein TatC
MELTDHLGELRSRIIRVILYLLISSVLTYNFFRPIYRFLFFPMEAVMAAHKAEGWSIRFSTFSEPFFVVLKISIISGLIIVSPFVLFEVWGFIAPALTKDEKKPLRYLAPLATVLFFLGVTLAYWVSRFAIGWFVGYVNWFPHAQLLQDPEMFVMFMLKMMGIFGLVFELPILLMFLAWIGLLNSSSMKKSWRMAIVIISVVGVIITPSNDLFTMVVMIVPVMLLYVGSIGLVRIIERNKEKNAL